MSNPVDKLYGTYAPFDHAKAQVLDGELNMYAPLDYVVPAGPSNRIYDTVTSSTQRSTQTQNFIRQMTLEDLTSSWVVFNVSVAFTFAANTVITAANLVAFITAGNIFMNQFPLQQAATNIQCIAAGTTISLDPSTLASPLLRGYKDLDSNPYIEAWPSMGDVNPVYTEATVNKLNVVNQDPSELPPGTKTRNLNTLDWQIIPGPVVNLQPTALGFTVRWQEAPLIDIFSLVRDGKPAISGINQIQFILTFASPAPRAPDAAVGGKPLERVFSMVHDAPLSATIGGVGPANSSFTGVIYPASTITFNADPEMNFIQYSQNLSWPLFNMYSRPYSDYTTGYQTQNISPDPVAPIPLPRPVKTTYSCTMNSQTILEIPKMFIIWTGLQGSFRRAWDPFWCGIPQSISIRFAGAQNLLASVTPLELFNLSVKNGLNMTWYQAQQCGFPLFLLPSDLGLSAGALCLEGVTGSYQVQISNFVCSLPPDINLNGVAPLTITNMQGHMIPVYSNEFQINNNRANIVSVAGMDANSAVSIPFVDSSNAEIQSVLSGGKFFDSVKKGFKKLVHFGENSVLPAMEKSGPIVEEVLKDYKKMKADMKGVKGAGTTKRLQYR